VQCRIENSEKNAEKCTEVHDSKKKKKIQIQTVRLPVTMLRFAFKTKAEAETLLSCRD
jgi:hypothetical protein